MSDNDIILSLALSRIGEIIAASINHPGSYHDSRISWPIYDRLEEDTPETFWIAADSAFPHNVKRIQGKIYASLKSGARVRQDQVKFFQEVVSFRQAAEWGMRAIQGSFGRLRLPLDVDDAPGRLVLLETVFRMYQVRVRMVGINQLKSVYSPIWTATDEDLKVWKHLDELFFPEIRKMDRVKKFHLIVEQD